MLHPSLYHSNYQMPCPDAINPASHLGTCSTPHRQRDRASSAASRRNDFQTMCNTGMNNYLSPGSNGFYNTWAQPDDDAMGTENNWTRSPGNLNVSRTSITTSLFRSKYLPLQAELRVRDPLHDIHTNDRGSGEQLEAYLNGCQPNCFQPQGIAHLSSYLTGAPPFNRVTPQGPGTPQHIGSQTIHHDGENVRAAADPGQPSSTSFDCSYAAPPQISDPPYISTPVALSPRINFKHCEPSRNPADSSILTTCYPTWTVPKAIKTESLDNFTPSHHPRNASELNGFKSPTTNPIPRLRRHRHRRDPTASRSKASDSSNTATSPCPPPPPPPPHPRFAGNVESSKTFTPSYPIGYDSDLTYPLPSNDSVECQDDSDEFLRYITTLYDDTQPLGGDCPVVDLGAPNEPVVNEENVSDASELDAVEHGEDQPVGDVEPEKSTMPQGKKRARTTSDSISPEPEQRQQAKKPRRETNPNSAPRKASDDSLFFCVNQECPRSQNKGFGGFKSKEDAKRHLLVHKPADFVCRGIEDHRNGREQYFRRPDNMRE